MQSPRNPKTAFIPHPRGGARGGNANSKFEGDPPNGQQETGGQTQTQLTESPTEPQPLASDSSLTFPFSHLTGLITTRRMSIT
ncbi:MAG: hypothetical protein ACK57U_06985, partial [Planctomycetota bacterium]